MDKGKPNNRKVKAAETRQKIYESADQLFQKYGFESVSVDSIVEMAGVSKGSFYVYFESKNSLIEALITDFVYKLDLDYKSFISSFAAGMSASDMLITLVEKIADIMTNSIGYNHIKIIYQVQITKTQNTDAILGYNRDLYKILGDIITRGIQQGEFKTDIYAETIANHFIICIRGLTYEWCVRYPDFDLRNQVVEHFKILLSGIKK